MTSTIKASQGGRSQGKGPGWAGWVACLSALLVASAGWQQGLFAEAQASFIATLATITLVVLVMLALMTLRPASRAGVLACLVAVFLVCIAYYCGIASLVASLLMCLGAMAVSTLIPLPAESAVAVRLLAGLAVLASLVGWLLPFPVHGTRGYLLLALGLVCWRWLAMRPLLEQSLRGWRETCERAPGWLLLVIASMFVAGLGLWLPSLNYDDNSAHLLFPFQLLRDGYYHLDVQTQLWGVAPWANNVLHGIAALLSGTEARAAVNLLWLLLGMHGAYRLASALDAPRHVALAAAALYASQPLTGYFTTSMQVDGASAVVLLYLASLMVTAGRTLPSPILTGLLFGLLAGLKATNAVYAIPALAWLAWLSTTQHTPGWLLRMFVTAALIGGASYLYAFAVTGNPLFPLFNTVFKSSYYPLADFFDSRWSAGLSWRSAWDLTMHSDRYGEVFPGAWGIATLALLPAVALGSTRDARLRWLALWFLVTGIAMFATVQYLRYTFPATAVLSVLGVVALHRLAVPRAFAVVVVLLVAGNACLLPTTSWMARQDPWRALLQRGSAALPDIEADMAPERALLRRISGSDPRACTLLVSPNSPYIGVAGGNAFSVNGSYDMRMARAYALARNDPSGLHWQRLLQSLGMSHVMTPTEVDPVLARVLQDNGFEVVDTLGPVEAWAHPDPGKRACTSTLEHERDEAHRRLHWEDSH